MIIFQADAFSRNPFEGNPAGVCVLEEILSEDRMQRIAAEMNLSETAFLKKRPDGYDLRWFTPVAEVDLCGHATLASAHVLWERSFEARSSRLAFHTASGLLSANLRGDWIEMDFPAEPPVATESPQALQSAFGFEPKYVGKNRLDYLIEAPSDETVRGLQPDFAAILKLGMRGVMVTAESQSPEFDFVSRYFAPAFGIQEDPVTGSAHCCLGPYWHDKLKKDELTGYQASARGGIVKVAVKGDRVLLRGQAVTTLECNLIV